MIVSFRWFDSKVTIFLMKNYVSFLRYGCNYSSLRVLVYTLLEESHNFPFRSTSISTCSNVLVFTVSFFMASISCFTMQPWQHGQIESVLFDFNHINFSLVYWIYQLSNSISMGAVYCSRWKVCFCKIYIQLYTSHVTMSCQCVSKNHVSTRKTIFQLDSFCDMSKNHE